MMRVTLISLAMCLPHLLGTPVLQSTTAVSPSATEIKTTALDLRIRTTTSDPLKLPLSTTENHPGRTSGTFNTQVKKSASLAAVNNSGRTTQGRGILRTGTATYATTAGQKSNRHTTAGDLRRETESYIHHETPFSGHTASPTTDHPSTTTLPGEEGTEYHDSSTTETAREFNTPNSIETWAADTSNDSRLAKPHLDRSQAADQHTATQGLEMASVDTASGDYYTTQRDFFTNTPTNRVTGLNRVQRERERRVRRGGEKVSGVDLENLWVDQMSSVEERVEFWYANGSTMGPDHKRESGRDRVKERGRREQQRQKGTECDNLWTQPKVTLEDITDFWYANGRVIPEETKDQMLLETCV
ncbi:unnamed protein product [Coregonus sp. 'balchen']|nr:unnamed protein product [Coregonus sp. 'balchen']